MLLLYILVSSCWHRILTRMSINCVQQRIGPTIERSRRKPTQKKHCTRKKSRSRLPKLDNKMPNQFKLGAICICHLNHHKNSSDLNHFENVQFENQNFRCTSYKWMFAWTIDIAWKRREKKKQQTYTSVIEILHVSSLDWIGLDRMMIIVANFLMYGVCKPNTVHALYTYISRWNDVKLSVLLCVSRVYILKICIDFYKMPWLGAFIRNLWFKRSQQAKHLHKSIYKFTEMLNILRNWWQSIFASQSVAIFL